MNKRIVPSNNYIIFGLVAIISFISAFYLANWYKDIRYEIENTPIINTIVPEVLIEEFDNYVVENSSFVLYLASSSDTSIRSFEKSFKKLIINNDIYRQIVYLDASKVANNDFYDHLKDKYLTGLLTKQDMSINPNVIVFKDRKIVDILYSKSTNINIDIVKQYLVDNEVIE
jgi:hypothetical protein